MVENLSKTFETILHYNPLIIVKQKILYKHEHKWQTLIKMTCRGKSEQSRTEIAKRRSFIYLVMFVKLMFRPSNIVFIGISSLMIARTNNLAIFSGSVS